jgi:SAM-dependent methyltransferase
VDGAAYLIGLAAAAIGMTSLGWLRLVRPGHRAARAAGGMGVALGLAAAMPAVLGIQYVTSGKLALRDRLLDAVPWTGHDVVVDIGAGRGLLAIGAAHRTRALVHCVDLFIGKDLSGNTPQHLLANAALEGVADRLVVHREDAADLSLPDASADVVLSTLCLHNIADPSARTRALDHIVRVLAPGGTVVISDLAHVRDEYAPHLASAGLDVQPVVRAAGTFPPQNVLIARKPSTQQPPA